MSNSKYEYIKFKKLSDAVKAWEDGEGLCFININGQYRKKDSGDFFSAAEYYRRIEVKPFECWAIFWKDGGFVGVVESDSEPHVLSGQRAVRLREVIE